MLIDSNILVYAINRSSPKHKKAQRFLQKNLENLFIAHQNIFETLRVLTHAKFPSPMRPADAIVSIENIAKVCKIINPDYKTHCIALELVKKYKLSGDKVFDGYLAATAISNGVTTIATDNMRDFKRFVEIKVINPFNSN